MIGESEAMSLTRWLETQSPLWVIYALVILFVVAIGRQLLKWFPTVFEKHCFMLDTATKSMADSATVIAGINVNVNNNNEKLTHGQVAMADAAVPACKAILVVTPPEKRQEVREHLDEVVRILSKPILKA
jgi:hypothetical protein